MANERALLEAHVRGWTGRGLLDVPTGDRLLADIDARYSRPAAEAGEASRFSVGVWILFSLGTVALAAALAVWLARDWGEWGRWTRILVSLAVPSTLAAVGLRLVGEGRPSFPALGKVFLTLTAVATLSATNLLAITYDFHPRHATITLVEAAIFGGMAFLADSALLLWTSVLALSAGFGFEVYSTWGGTWISLQRPLPFVGLGFAVVATGLLARSRNARLGGQLLVAGALMTQLALFFLSLKAFERTSPPPTATTVRAWLVLFLPFVIALCLLAYLAARDGRLPSFARASVIPLFSLLLLFALSSLWPGRFYERSWVDTSLFTLATLAAAVFGVQVRSPGVINVAVVFFAVDVFARFSEWFWDEMPAFQFFGLMGLLLILGGVSLERVRRRLIRRIGAPA